MFNAIRRHLVDWRLRSSTRRRLAMLDDRLLSDIGTERDGIADFVASLERKGR